MPRWCYWLFCGTAVTVTAAAATLTPRVDEYDPGDPFETPEWLVRAAVMARLRRQRPNPNLPNFFGPRPPRLNRRQLPFNPYLPPQAATRSPEEQYEPQPYSPPAPQGPLPDRTAPPFPTQGIPPYHDNYGRPRPIFGQQPPPVELLQNYPGNPIQYSPPPPPPPRPPPVQFQIPNYPGPRPQTDFYLPQTDTTTYGPPPPPPTRPPETTPRNEWWQTISTATPSGSTPPPSTRTATIVFVTQTIPPPSTTIRTSPAWRTAPPQSTRPLTTTPIRTTTATSTSSPYEITLPPEIPYTAPAQVSREIPTESPYGFTAPPGVPYETSTPRGSPPASTPPPTQPVYEEETSTVPSTPRVPVWRTIPTTATRPPTTTPPRTAPTTWSPSTTRAPTPYPPEFSSHEETPSTTRAPTPYPPEYSTPEENAPTPRSSTPRPPTPYPPEFSTPEETAPTPWSSTPRPPTPYPPEFSTPEETAPPTPSTRPPTAYPPEFSTTPPEVPSTPSSPRSSTPNLEFSIPPPIPEFPPSAPPQLTTVPPLYRTIPPRLLTIPPVELTTPSSQPLISTTTGTPPPPPPAEERTVPPDFPEGVTPEEMTNPTTESSSPTTRPTRTVPRQVTPPQTPPPSRATPQTSTPPTRPSSLSTTTPLSAKFTSPPPRSPTTSSPPPPSTPPPSFPTLRSSVSFPTKPPTIPPYKAPINESDNTNRVIGKAHVICTENGIDFRVNTLFPFTGQVFAYDRQKVPDCVHSFTNETRVHLQLTYAECGIPNQGKTRKGYANYHLQIVVLFDQRNGSTTMQSFIARCIEQKVQYTKQDTPRRIEEALEELQLVPTKLEQKAKLPEIKMVIVKEVDHHMGDDGKEVNEVDLGQPLRIEWSLQPESDAYGFHVRNCTVKDLISGEEYLVIDEMGCSTDNNIFAHPHYDTYHDKAFVHWHAFKVPDSSQLRIRCDFVICSDIKDDQGATSCGSIPSPPYCPEVITSSSNSILFDQVGNFILAKRSPADDPMLQSVHADICVAGDEQMDEELKQACRSERDMHRKDRPEPEISRKKARSFCVSKLWLSIATGLSVWSVLLAVVVHAICTTRRRKMTEDNNQLHKLKQLNQTEEHVTISQI